MDREESDIHWRHPLVLEIRAPSGTRNWRRATAVFRHKYLQLQLSATRAMDFQEFLTEGDANRDSE
jgi:hypothetical protein